MEGRVGTGMLGRVGLVGLGLGPAEEDWAVVRLGMWVSVLT
jgi:hypothetical protein